MESATVLVMPSCSSSSVSSELLGFGTLFGLQIIPDSAFVENGGLYMNNGMMTMPAMALIIVACVIWAHRAYNKDIA